MSVEAIVRVAKNLLKGQKLTRAAAKAIASQIESEDITTDAGMGYRTVADGALAPLTEAFPEFKWRIATDQSGERTRAFVTIMTDDSREHFVGPGSCCHCGKDHNGRRVRGTP